MLFACCAGTAKVLGFYLAVFWAAVRASRPGPAAWRRLRASRVGMGLAMAPAARMAKIWTVEKRILWASRERKSKEIEEGDWETRTESRQVGQTGDRKRVEGAQRMNRVV